MSLTSVDAALLAALFLNDDLRPPPRKAGVGHHKKASYELPCVGLLALNLRERFDCCDRIFDRLRNDA